ncbi:MAG: hypothetical protein CMP65_02915, partial [Flavobacteriales bacterium]|nr:hypothetical protein [Flavobacteriales bacterium]
MKKILSTLVVIASLLTFFNVNAQDLFISEYAEGSSNNKYIEIYNGTGSDVDLSSYEMWKISNGGSWAESTLSLSGTLASGDVYVLCNGSSDGTILAQCDEVWSQANFNGDDAIGLAKDGVLIDAVGQDGSDPGSAFDVCDGDTKDNTIVRNCDITQGNPDWSVSSASETCEWTVYSNNTWDYLGSHDSCVETNPCGEVLCEIYCELGFVVDENGCEICECIEPACENDDSASDAYGDTCSSWYDANEGPGSYGCSGGYDT